MTETRWWRFVQRVIGDDTAQEAARRAGFDKSAFTRWKKGARADPDFVLKFARSYGVNVLEALVEAEFITDEEAQLVEVERTPREALESVGNHELALEFVRRLGAITVGTDDTRESIQAKGAVLGMAGMFGNEPTSDELAAARGRRSQMSDLPDSVAAHIDDEKGVPDIPSEAEESQDPGEEDFDPA